ncbi:hypothetical protein THJ026_19670 [Campylobacter jejuni]|nr:hypothetical protein THJ026_19670 [Campylobacter jejuni]
MNGKTYKFHPNDTKMDKKIIQITEKFGFKAAVFSMAAMTMLGSWSFHLLCLLSTDILKNF